VASATQDGGAYTAITINAHGAFYRPQGNVSKVFQEGGPVHSDGARLLTVGSYRGDTLPAQMVTLFARNSGTSSICSLRTPTIWTANP